LTLDPSNQPVFDFAVNVAQTYSALTESADREMGLGGKLFYAGELDEWGRALIVAANIAGAATLVASSDRPAQKQAMRDGVADFLVNSLDEALRILKNQLRKRETVSVCAGLSTDVVEREMEERGVQPDLLRRDLSIAPGHKALMMQQGEETALDLLKIPAIVTWSVAAGRPQELAKLDEIALACLDEHEWKARRWLRLSPRYLGRLAKGLRLVASHREFAARFQGQLRECIARDEIPFAFEACSYFRGTHDQFRFEGDKH
jgi:hypothetical protein